MDAQRQYGPIRQIRQHFLFYLTGTLILLGMKYFYSKAGCSELRWILGPTAKWVTLLSGIPFVYEPEAGYVNHELRMIIAPSCSGFQFMMICTAMFLFSFLRDMAPEGRPISLRKGFCRIVSSILLSYPLTVFINGLRIIAAFHLPPALAKAHIAGTLLTPERLHSAIGITVYFSSLLTVYQLSAKIHSGTMRRGFARRCLPPLFWYFALVLGLPFLNGAYGADSRGFGAFALLVFACCSVVLLLYLLTLCIQRAFGGRAILPHSSSSASQWSWGRHRRERE